MTGGVALVGKAGGAIRGRLEFFGSFLFGAKKEHKNKSLVKDAIKDLLKVKNAKSEMLKGVQHDRWEMVVG